MPGKSTILSYLEETFRMKILPFEPNICISIVPSDYRRISCHCRVNGDCCKGWFENSKERNLSAKGQRALKGWEVQRSHDRLALYVHSLGTKQVDLFWSQWSPRHWSERNSVLPLFFIRRVIHGADSPTRGCVWLKAQGRTVELRATYSSEEEGKDCHRPEEYWWQTPSASETRVKCWI